MSVKLFFAFLCRNSIPPEYVSVYGILFSDIGAEFNTALWPVPPMSFMAGNNRLPQQNKKPRMLLDLIMSMRGMIWVYRS